MLGFLEVSNIPLLARRYDVQREIRTLTLMTDLLVRAKNAPHPNRRETLLRRAERLNKYFDRVWGDEEVIV